MYNKRTFGKGLGASFVVLIVVTLVVFSTSAYAVPLAGIGGFTIKADELTAESAFIYPGVDDTSNQAAYPMAVVEQKDVKIENLRLLKTFDVSNVPGLSGNARVVITASDTVTVDQQMIKVSNIQAETATFNQQVIDESNSDDPANQFGIWSGNAAEEKVQDGRIVDLNNEGPAQRLTNTTITAHYLASSSISIPGMSLEVQYDEDGDGQYNE